MKYSSIAKSKRIPASAYKQAQRMEWKIRRGQFFLLMVVFLNIGVQFLRFQVGYALMSTSLVAQYLPRRADMSDLTVWALQLTLMLVLWLLFIYIGSKLAYRLMIGYWLWDGVTMYLLSTRWDKIEKTGNQILAPVNTVEYLQAIAAIELFSVLLMLFLPSIRMYLNYMRGKL